MRKWLQHSHFRMLYMSLSTHKSPTFGTKYLPCRRFLQHYYRDTFIESHRKPIEVPQISYGGPETCKQLSAHRNFFQTHTRTGSMANTYSFALGTTNPTTMQPIKPAAQTTIRIGTEEIKKIVEIATIVAISRRIDMRLRRVRPPLSRYSRIYLPKKDCNSHACKRGELR